MQRGLNFLFISDFWGDRSNAVGRGKEYYNAILHAKFLSTWREKFVQAHLLHPSFIKMQSVLRRTNRKFKKSSKIYISSPYNLRLACFAHCFISISQEYWCRSHIGPSYIQIYQDISTFCVSFFSQSMFWAQYSWFHTSYRPECLVDQSCEEFFLYVKTIKFFWICIFNLLLPKCKKEVIYIQLLIIIEKNKCSVVWGGDFVVLIKFLHIWLCHVYFLFFF